MYKIEKNIPIPPIKLTTSQKLNTALKELKIGDSFAVPKAEVLLVKRTAYSKAKQLRILITIRNIENGKIRVWRLDPKTQMHLTRKSRK